MNKEQIEYLKKEYRTNIMMFKTSRNKEYLIKAEKNFRKLCLHFELYRDNLKTSMKGE
jgi:hypothetical protein